MELLYLEVAQATNKPEETRMEILLTENVLSSATKNLRVSSSRNEVGTESFSDHLEAQALWSQTKQAYVDAHMNNYLRHIEYCKATGKL